MTAGDKVLHSDLGDGKVMRTSEDGSIVVVKFTGRPEIVFKSIDPKLKVIPKIVRKPHVDPFTLTQYSLYNDAVHGVDFDEAKNHQLVQVLDAWCIMYGSMKIGCNPSYEPEAIKILTNLGLPEYARFLRIGKTADENQSGESHGMWTNIFIPDPQIPDIDVDLGVYFNPRRLNAGVYQLSKLSYVNRLLGKVSMDPRSEDEAETLLQG